MPARVAAVVGSVLLAGCSVVGLRDGTEQPPYAVVATLAGAIEIRQYGPRLVAETMVADPDGGGATRAFRILAGYIFGGNRDRRNIAMTAPLETADGPESDGSMRMRFFLPASITAGTAPRPNAANVTVTIVPGARHAVRRFTGLRRDQETEAQIRALRQALTAAGGWDITGPPVAWFYDPPWTLPFLRRNEVAFPVRQTP